MLLAFVLGCQPEAGLTPAENETTPTWHGEVRPIVESACVACHQEGEAGGFPLDSYELVSAMSEQVADAVEDRRMPPWLAGPGCNDYQYDISLSEQEIETLVAWHDAGAPEGDPEASVEGKEMEWRELPRVDVTLAAPSYIPDGAVEDDYRCFVVEWPEQGNFVTGYDIRPENPELVHHVVLYLADSELAPDFQAADDADEGAGYSCYGGPGVVGASNADWLGAWAPGAVSGEFPEGTGIWVGSGDVIVFQVHYNMKNAEPAEDLIEIDLMVEDSVPDPALIQPWADPSWIDSEKMEIPANSEGTQHDFGIRIPDQWAFRIHTASVHMHELGRSARIWATHEDGTEECVLDVPRWDFAWQRSYLLEEAVDIPGGTTLTLECTWDNPTGEDVFWGDGTGDEMCLGTMFLTSL